MLLVYRCGPLFIDTKMSTIKDPTYARQERAIQFERTLVKRKRNSDFSSMGNPVFSPLKVDQMYFVLLWQAF